MKKLLLAAVATAFIATPAMAQQAPRGPEINYNLDAEVKTICGVYSFIGTEVQIDFGELADTASSAFVEKTAALGASAQYRCNSPAGFTRTITSANDGVLVRTNSSGGTANEIDFEMQHGGGNGLDFGWQSLAGGKTDVFGGSTTFLNAGQGTAGLVSFRARGVLASNSPQGAIGTTVFAGDYTDVVTIAVTAN